MATAVSNSVPPGMDAFRDPSFDPRSPLPQSVHPLPAAADSREREAMSPSFSHDLAENLKDLAAAVAAKKSVDPEFLQILQQDIDALRQVYERRSISHDSHVWSELYRMNVRLQQVAATMNGLASGHQFPPTQAPASAASWMGKDVVVPLVGVVEDPLHVSSDNASVNKGLQILHDGGYRVRRVRGNGQCLFSSIATLLLTEERLTALRSQLPNLKDRALYGDLDPLSLIDTCLQMLHDGVSVEALLQNPQTNDRWVNFLRTIATNWLHKEIIQNHECQVQLAQAAREAIPELRQNDNDREVCQIYLRRMASMTEPCYGGEPEIFALKSILGIDIHSIDVKTLGSLTSQAAVDSSLPQIADLSDIWLLYHGSHFDPLYLPEQIPHGMLDVD